MNFFVIAFEISVVLGLTACNGVLAMSELALVSSRRGRLETLARSGLRGARAALRLIEDPNRFLATVQIGITLIGILAGAYSGATLGFRLGDWLDTVPALAPNGEIIGIALVVVLITYLSLIFGELVPKRIALADPEKVAARVAPAMALLAILTAPAVWLLRWSTDAVLRMLGLQRGRDARVTEDEVKALVAEGARAGVFAPRERDMIEGVLRIADRSVRVIMTPRPEMVWLDASDDGAVLAGKLGRSLYTAYPVGRNSIDQVIGVVLIGDLLRRVVAGEPVNIARAMTTPLFVPGSTPVLKLLDRFQRDGVYIAIVVDEFGVTEGMVTTADILASIAGEFTDGDDPEDASITEREDGSWLVDGSLPIDEFEDRLGIVGLSDAGDFHTVAGFVLHKLGRIPVAGDAFDFAGHRFEVVDMDSRRIDRLLIVPLPPREQ